MDSKEVQETMEVIELVSTIDSYLDGKLSDEQLVDYTMGLIASDDFVKQDERLQDLVYELDNKELNELNDSDVKRIRNELSSLANMP
jgi:hypothetical protein